MEAPDEALREDVSARLNELIGDRVERPGLIDAPTEEGLTAILGVIHTALEEQTTVSEEENPGDVLDAVNSWAGLISYAVGRVYGPSSPWPFGLAG